MRDLHPYLETLAQLAHPAGGWGYAPDQEAHLEPTCLAMLALSLEAARYRVELARARMALERHAVGNGSYVLTRGRAEAIWPTALVLFLKSALGDPHKEVESVALRLLASPSRVLNELKSSDLFDIDISLVGWSWAENNFSWADPTSWACLALTQAGFGGHPRVDEGRRLLIDRAQDTGGINYGNRRVFSAIAEPIPGPTALMLLALQGNAKHPRVSAAACYLERQVLEVGDDLEDLGWAKLALECVSAHPGDETAHQQAMDALDQRLVAAHQVRSSTDWLRPAPLRQALTVLALATDRKNYFREPQETQRETTVTIPAPAVRRPTWKQRITSALRKVAVEGAGNLRPAMVHSKVHIAPVTTYDADLAGILGEQYENFRQRVPLAGKRVVLKPNLVEFYRDRPINTHSNVVAAVIELCKREGAAEVIVAEGPGHWRNVEYLVRSSGLGDVLKHYHVPFIDLNHDEPVKCLNVGRLTGLEYLYVSRTAHSAEVLISLPKLKTHHWAGVTLSLKNLFGIVPGICYGWPKNELHWRGIENSVIDIALTRTPDLAIVDGIIGMEGDGPLKGTSKPLGALIMGTDLMAVDATCCRLMQITPEKIPYLLLGLRKKLGILDERAIEQLGEKIVTLSQPFEVMPHFKEIVMEKTA